MSQHHHSGMFPTEAIDPDAVRKLFARPDRIAGSAFLRREIASRMRERLALIKLAPRRVLDAGCGEGVDSLKLQQDFSQATILAIDAAPEMLATARHARTAAGNALQRWLASWQNRSTANLSQHPAYVAGDYASLPLASGKVDLVWSNLALHWHVRPDAVLAEWRRVLQTNGLLMFSCFGPDTFKELRIALAAAGDPDAVLPFTDMHDLGDMLVHAGFSTPVMDMETITLTYSTVDRLLADVRAFGGNPLRTRRKALSGKERGRRLREAIEKERHADGLIRLTIEAVYGHAFLPSPTKTAAGESIIRFERR